MRRGADLLLARPEVDPHRLAFVGHSYNATVGAILAGVDRRFKAYVLMAGALSDQVDFRSDEYRKYIAKIGHAKWDPFAAAHAWADPGPYVASAAPADRLPAVRDAGGLPDARAREGVRRERERAEALQAVRGAARAERRSAPRPSRVPRRDARGETAGSRGRRRRPGASSSRRRRRADGAPASAASRSSRGS